MKKALITGICGQDGSYLAELLLSKGYEVHGIIRRSSTFNTSRIDHIFHRLNLHYGDLLDGSCIQQLVHKIQPDEIYHLAAMSHVKVSFEIPCYTVESCAIGTLNILEAVRSASPHSRVYNASSSEMFGNTPGPQNEESLFNARSPYAAGKIAAHHLCKNYREAYGLHVSSGILFNHESPRRGETFVSRKITKAAAKIKLGFQDKLILGNLYSKRDWGYAKEYVEAMHIMLQSETPDDYVIATGKAYSVDDFLHEVFDYAGLSVDKYVEINDKYYRPTEVDYLCGDMTKFQKKFDWSPKTDFKKLCHIMYDEDYFAINSGY